MKISEMITDRYKLRIPPTVYYDLLTDVQEVEEEQESTTKNDSSELEKNSKKIEKGTTKNDLAVDIKQLKTMIRGLTKWYVKRDNTEVGEPNTAVGLLYDDVMFGIDRLPSVTPQEPRCKECKWWKDSDGEYRRGCGAESKCLINTHAVYCGEGYCYMFESQESEDRE